MIRELSRNLMELVFPFRCQFVGHRSLVRGQSDSDSIQATASIQTTTNQEIQCMPTDGQFTNRRSIEEQNVAGNDLDIQICRACILQIIASGITDDAAPGCNVPGSNVTSSNLTSSNVTSSNVTEVRMQRCPRCSAVVPIPEHFAEGCRVCFGQVWRFESIRTFSNYHGSLREAVLQLKRPRQENFARQMGRLMGRELFAKRRWDNKTNRKSDLQPKKACGQPELKKSMKSGETTNSSECIERFVICHVPIQWRRKLIPDWNPSAVLAYGMSEATRIPALSSFLEFNRATQKQGTLSRRQRTKNVNGSMTARRSICLAGKTVILVDDVVTSGATANEATRVLMDAGAERVLVVACARGIGFG